jgi:hypothetical protein
LCSDSVAGALFLPIQRGMCTLAGWKLHCVLPSPGTRVLVTLTQQGVGRIVPKIRRVGERCAFFPESKQCACSCSTPSPVMGQDLLGGRGPSRIAEDSILCSSGKYAIVSNSMPCIHLLLSLCCNGRRSEARPVPLLTG